MSILLVGLNHKTAPVEVRERLAFADEACASHLPALIDGAVVREALIVSTCNRVEVLAEANAARADEALPQITRFLSAARALPLADFHSHLYAHEDDAAIRHLFRVASSLDSMVVGEAQILGQVRRAYSLAVEAGTAGRVLNRLVHNAFHVAKRVRNETGIAAAAVSISYMAVELGRKVFGSLKGRNVLLIGAGEMAELSAKHLLNAGAGRITIANRTRATAENLALNFSGETADFEDLTSALAEADIIICSTGADDYVVTPALARAALERRRNQPSFFIDISVPRNVDPRVGEIPNLFVFDIDDLESVIASNIREREKEAERATLIVEAEVMQFQQSLRVLDVGQSIGALRQKMQDIAQTELEKQRARLGTLTPEQEAAVAQLLRATVNKVSHPLLAHLRRASYNADYEAVRALTDIYGLDEADFIATEPTDAATPASEQD